MSPAAPVAAVAIVVLATAGIGTWAMRYTRTTSDFLVASRSVSPLWNASAIGGEYLSAASFLGVAGLIMAYGADMLWYPVGFVAGYVILLLLVAAPLRRSGAYTLPDFAELRLRSPAVRAISSALVVVICWLYLIPQLQGAGLTLRTVTGTPRWVGPAVVAFIVVANAVAGGMRGITFVQGFQFCVKLSAIAIPALVIAGVWLSSAHPALTAPTRPTFPQATTVTIGTDTGLTVPKPVDVNAHGTIDHHAYAGALRLTAGSHEIAAGTTVRFPGGATVPRVSGLPDLTGERWSQLLAGFGESGHPLYATYSLIIATFLGTMGLPHVLVRFYTNPDGRAARRTTLLVLGLLGVFYLFPTIYGALGRVYVPQLLTTGRTDAVVLLLPSAMVGGGAGQFLGALVAAGAFAAFLSTSGGLTVSVAGVLSHDLLPGGVRSFRQSAVIAGGVPLALALLASDLPVSEVVGMAFAVAASSFCPLLLLGIWWRGLTAAGAAAGLVVGGGLAVAAVSLPMAGVVTTGWWSVVLAQPALITVPVAFAVMVSVSRLSARDAPDDVGRIMLRMHAPEGLGIRLGAAR